MNKRLMIYSAFFAVTLVTFTSLLVVANTEDSVQETNIISSEVLLGKNVRQEYLVNETIDLTNVSLKVNDRYVSATDCEVEYDFSNAGDKVVTLSYSEENKIYQGYYQVKSFMVRHLDIRKKDITIKPDGTYDTSSFVVWAELNAPSIEFKKPEEYPYVKDTVIILDEKYYTLEIEEAARKGYYNGHVKVGYLDSAFSFITNTDDPKVDSTDRILEMINDSNTEDKLTLFVQTNSNNFVAPNGSNKIDVTGTYLLETTDGNKKEYKFNYSLDGWTSSFKSSSNNEGLVDKQDGDNFVVTVNNLTFHANGPAWRKAILNM